MSQILALQGLESEHTTSLVTTITPTYSHWSSVTHYRFDQPADSAPGE